MFLFFATPPIEACILVKDGRIMRARSAWGKGETRVQKLHARNALECNHPSLDRFFSTRVGFASLFGSRKRFIRDIK